jgi:flagellar hook assembly protein FlgD
LTKLEYFLRRHALILQASRNLQASRILHANRLIGKKFKIDTEIIQLKHEIKERNNKKAIWFITKLLPCSL